MFSSQVFPKLRSSLVKLPRVIAFERCSSTTTSSVAVPVDIMRPPPNPTQLKTIMEAVNRQMEIPVDIVPEKIQPKYEAVERITEEHWVSFMQGIGNHKTAFNLSDYKIWKDSFKDDCKMVFICLEGTNTVAGCMKFVWQRALPSSHQNIDCILVGDLYVDDAYRGKDIMKLMAKCVKEQTNGAGNVVWSAMKTSEAFCGKIFPNAKGSFTCHQALYKRENVKIPNLSFDDIVVKNSNEVSDEDITKYDQSIHPFERKNYILSVLRDSEGFGKVAFDSTTGKVIGFGSTTIYPSGHCTLFPMYGDNEQVVQSIFQDCLKDIQKSGKRVTHFDCRTAESEGFDRLSWMKPFLTHEPESKYLARYFYTQEMQKGFDMSKVFVIASPSVCAI